MTVRAVVQWSYLYILTEYCLALNIWIYCNRASNIGIYCKVAVVIVGCFSQILIFINNVLQCLTMNTLTIRLPEDLKDDLQKLSEEQSKPVSDIVRESIRRYVAVEKFRALRKKVLPFAEAQGFLTDEDVFKAIS